MAVLHFAQMLTNFGSQNTKAFLNIDKILHGSLLVKENHGEEVKYYRSNKAQE